MRKFRSITIEVIVVLFVILFLYTGISKLMDYTLFKEQMAVSPLLAPVASLVARVLPWTEFLVVLLLIVPRWRLKGLFSALILMMLFTGYIIAILTFSKDIPCSCGGVIELLSWNAHIVFNSIFIGLAAIGAFLQRGVNKENRKRLSALLLPRDKQQINMG